MQIIEDLIERTEWIAASVALRDADEARAREQLALLAMLSERIANRASLLAQLAKRFALTDSEQRVLMLLVAMRMHGEVRTRIQQAARTDSLTVDVIRDLIYGSLPSLAGLRELAPTGALRRFVLMERDDDHGPHAHESKQTWTVAPRVLAFLHGDAEIDGGVARRSRPWQSVAFEDVVASNDARDLARVAVAREVIVIATGMTGLGRRTLLRSAAEAHGNRVLDIDLRRMAVDAHTFRADIHQFARECRLLDRVPLVENIDALDAVQLDVLAHTFDSGALLATCGVQRVACDWGRASIVIDVALPSSSQRAKLWSTSLSIREADARPLSTCYALAPRMIVRAAAAARARASDELDDADVAAGVRAVLDDALGAFARRVVVTQTWEDLVLADDQRERVVELIARIRERERVFVEWGFAAKVGKGLGTSALFSGPPGTGKTMVAALIAKELGLELYQVDLGKVVSKYIGETEKNLAAVFDAAETGHVIVLFDEADALFGKRTDVKSSNDRYANLETNYLLQRLETFAGICLLTSNHEKAIDPAFMRRLSLHLRFELPDEHERARLWRAMLPATAPVARDLDVAKLARRYEMSGGYIRNAALRAAFIAANDASPITDMHLERAACAEYEGMGKIAAPDR